MIREIMLEKATELGLTLYDDVNMLFASSDEIALYINEGGHEKDATNTSVYSFTFSVTAYCNQTQFDSCNEKLNELFNYFSRRFVEIDGYKGRLNLRSFQYMSGFQSNHANYQFSFATTGELSYSNNSINIHTLTINGVEVEEISPQDQVDAIYTTDNSSGSAYISSYITLVKTGFFLTSDTTFILDYYNNPSNQKITLTRKINDVTMLYDIFKIVQMQVIPDKATGLTIINLTLQKGG